MTIEKRTRGYEVLIRINADATIGAHYISIDEWLEDGVVVSGSINDPVCLGAATDNGIKLANIIGEFAVTTLSANEHLSEKISKLDQDAMDAAAFITKLEVSKLDLEADLKNFQELAAAETAGLTAHILSLKAKITELTKTDDAGDDSEI